MRKYDMAIIALLLLLAGLAFYYWSSGTEEAKQVVIKVDGQIVESASLDEDKELEIKNDYGYNLILIKNKNVSVLKADCKNKICQKSGEIGAAGESIICLPHHLSIEIIGGKKAIDAISN